MICFVAVVLYAGSSITMFVFFSIGGLQYIAPLIAMWTILSALALYMFDYSEAQAKAQEDINAEAQEAPAAVSMWALLCAWTLLAEIYLKGVVANNRSEGKTDNTARKWMLPAIEEQEKYACNTMLLHAAVTLAVFVMVRFRARIGTCLSMLVCVACLVAWVFKVVKGAPHILNMCVPSIVVPIYMLGCSMYYLGICTYVHNNFWATVIGAFEPVVEGLRAIRDDVTGWFVSAWTWVNGVGTVVNGWFVSVWTWVVNSCNGVGTVVKGWFVGAWTWVVNSNGVAPAVVEEMKNKSLESNGVAPAVEEEMKNRSLEDLSM
ncbi:hypothetical protein OROHE_017761 [Orobanche hederae]